MVGMNIVVLGERMWKGMNDEIPDIGRGCVME